MSPADRRAGDVPGPSGWPEADPECSFVVSVEHGGNHVPEPWRPLFVGKEALLASHRGWDPGAAALGRDLARRFGAFFIVSRTTRLLVDLNRSLGHPRLFSEVTRSLPLRERREILERYYRPHRERVTEAVAREVARGATVVHLAVHTFTPVLDGKARAVDIGLLYDPARARERCLGAGWARALRRLLPGLVVRRNAPYRGASDGLATAFRRLWSDEHYAGFEVEVNQRLLDPEDTVPEALGRALAEGLEAARAAHRRT